MKKHKISSELGKLVIYIHLNMVSLNFFFFYSVIVAGVTDQQNSNPVIKAATLMKGKSSLNVDQNAFLSSG